MSKFSLFQNEQPVFRPSEEGSSSAPWGLIIGFLLLIGLIVLLHKSVSGLVKVASTPPPTPGPSSADLQRLSEEIAKLNQPKPQP